MCDTWVVKGEYQALEAFLLSLEICFDWGRKKKKSGFATCNCTLFSCARWNEKQLDRVVGDMFVLIEIVGVIGILQGLAAFHVHTYAFGKRYS